MPAPTLCQTHPLSALPPAALTLCPLEWGPRPYPGVARGAERLIAGRCSCKRMKSWQAGLDSEYMVVWQVCGSAGAELGLGYYGAMYLMAMTSSGY